MDMDVFKNKYVQGLHFFLCVSVQFVLIHSLCKSMSSLDVDVADIQASEKHHGNEETVVTCTRRIPYHAFNCNCQFVYQGNIVANLWK